MKNTSNVSNKRSRHDRSTDARDESGIRTDREEIRNHMTHSEVESSMNNTCLYAHRVRNRIVLLSCLLNQELFFVIELSILRS